MAFLLLSWMHLRKVDMLHPDSCSPQTEQASNSIQTHTLACLGWLFPSGKVAAASDRFQNSSREGGCHIQIRMNRSSWEVAPALPMMLNFRLSSGSHWINLRTCSGYWNLCLAPLWDHRRGTCRLTSWRWSPCPSFRQGLSPRYKFTHLWPLPRDKEL